MNICILAPANDGHATVVQKALHAKGVVATIVDSRRVEFSLASSVRFHSSMELTIFQMAGGTQVSNADVVWLRRPISAPWSAVRDARDAEIYLHQDGLIFGLVEAAKMAVNPIDAAIRMESKLRGLAAAVSAGLQVPPSLFSADPEAVRTFFDEQNGQVIFKSHRPQPSVPGKSSGTAQVTPEVLNNSEAIQRQPGVYQRRLNILHELRVLVLGRAIRAVKVVNRSRFVDSRLMMGRENEVSATEVPRYVAECCIEMVHSNGLICASIDLAYVQGEGYIFLDLNPSGQFLWMEYCCPEVDVLDVFARFLISGSPDFEGGAATRHRVRLCDFAA